MTEENESTQNNAKRSEAVSGMVFHAARMMVGTLVSRVLGLVREMLTAALFGATRQLDAFFVAYTLANLSRQLLAEGALSASFVPVFSRTLSSEGKKSALDLARQALSVIIAGCATVIILGLVFAPLLVNIMAPGFDKEAKDIAVSLTRLMLPFLLLVSAGALAMGVLNSMGSFFIPAIAPALSNLAYILFLLATTKHITIWNLAFAVLIGGICHMGLQFLWCGKMDMPLRPTVPKKDNTQLRSMMALFLPYAAGLSLNQLNPLINRMLGSFLSAGSISVLTYADRVLQLPLGLFVIAISQAVLPMLSRQDPNMTDDFRDFVRDAMRFNLFVILPVAIGLAITSNEIVHLLFYRGAFNEWAWHSTSNALSLYALGLPGMASSTLIMRAIYARRMPKAAVMVTTANITVNLCASVLLMHYFRYMGLAAASAIAATSASVFAAYLLSRDIGVKLKIFDTKWLAKILPPIAAMSLFLFVLKTLMPYPADSDFLRRIVWIAASIILAAIVYAIATLLLKCSEWTWISGAVKKKKS
ncbi:MAG: murein biosynthesis integral membrane protein MurJ [Synergistes sp.]|nr:murein biosynthesis integral membrane protein MurJ [Synergistes sp.]